MNHIAFLQALLDWVSAHQSWAGVLVFAIALGESLAVVGLVMPGALLLFGAGALVAAGSMELWSTLAWAAAGAVVGDGVSFWLGHHYHMRLRVMWPMRRYPALLARGVDFFHRHGGKSIVMGRFIGPLRPFIPAVAGMLGMPVARYLPINLLSALVWAPAYILPGVVFGASLGLAAEVASRLVMLIVLVLALLFITIWLVRRIYRWLQPRAGEYIGRLLAWGTRHPYLGELSAALADPQHPEARGLLILALMLVGSTWAFVTILNTVLVALAPSTADNAAYLLLQGLRTPWADRIMVAFTQLGDRHVYVPVTVAVLAWLTWRRRYSAAAHWLGAVSFAVLMSHGLKLLLRVPRPPAMEGVLTDFAFPSAHATINTALYGFLAVLITRELPLARRWIPYVAAAVPITVIALSRLYLGAHWLSDVLGGITLGLAWAALLGIAYRRHAAPPVGIPGLTAVCLGALILAGTWHLARDHAGALERYAYRQPTQSMPAQAWWDTQWHALPTYRIDLRGRPTQPLDVQWAADLDDIRAALQACGWQAPRPLDYGSVLLWLSPQVRIDQLPVLPRVHDGLHESLVLTHPDPRPGVQLVLRLWPAAVTLSPSATPLWIGNVTAQQLVRTTPLFAYPRTTPDMEEPLRALEPCLGGWNRREAVRAALAPLHGPEWSGQVVLIRAE